MSESNLGRWLYFCNCGPRCRCNFRSETPADCPCGHATALRKVLAETEDHIYVCVTGESADVSNELHPRSPFTCANGEPLQGFTRQPPPRLAEVDGNDDPTG